VKALSQSNECLPQGQPPAAWLLTRSSDSRRLLSPGSHLGKPFASEHREHIVVHVHDGDSLLMLRMLVDFVADGPS